MNCVERLRCTSFSLSSNVICVCSLSFVCELRVDVGFECDECISGLILNLSLMDGGLGCDLWSLRAGGRSSFCLRLHVECVFSGSVCFEGESCVNVDFVCLSSGLECEDVCVFVQRCMRHVCGCWS